MQASDAAIVSQVFCFKLKLDTLYGKFREKCKHQMLPLSPSGGVTLEKDSPEAKGLGLVLYIP